jgi:hypothetical protein
MGNSESEPCWGFGEKASYKIIYFKDKKPILVIEEGAEEIDLAREMLRRYSQARERIDYVKGQLAEAEDKLKTEKKSNLLLEEAMALEGKGELKKISRKELNLIGLF